MQSSNTAGPRLLDGATGTVLLDGAAPGGALLELLVRTDPERVAAVHAAYAAAGCEAVTTCTFLAGSAHLEGAGLGGEVRAMNREAAALARRAVAGERARPLVLGSIGPGPAGARLDSAELEADARERAAGLLEGGADVLLLETQTEAAEAAALLAGALAARAEVGATEVELWVSFALRAGRLAGGAPLAEGLAAVAGRVELVALNCAAPAEIAAALPELAAAGIDRTGAWPNAGVPARDGGGAWRWPLGPEAFAAEAAALARAQGLAWIGGCCGTTPAHLAALVARLRRA